MRVGLGFILLVDMDWYRCNTGRDTRLINGCGPTSRVSEDPWAESSKKGFPL